jgi:hypothetical protein
MAAIEAGEIRVADQALSPEFVLTAVCCHWPPSDERAAAIRAAAPEVSDWEHFLRLVKRHRIAVQVRHALGETAIEIPVAIDRELKAIVDRVIRRGLRLAAETVRLQSLLTAAGIPNLALKGAALERLSYALISAKETRDIDLLVPQECAEAALMVIEHNGYRLSLPATKLSAMQRRALICYGREIELINPHKGLRVELQWRTADNPWPLRGVSARSKTQTVPLSEGAAVRTLAPDDLFSYLCVHGARHSWSRLKWLADLNALLVSSNADVEHHYRHAQKIGAGLCAAQGLLLCQRLLGLKLPAGLAKELETNRRHQKLVAIAMRAMTAPSTGSDRDPGIRGVLRELRNRFLLGQGLRFYLAECRLALVGSADIVRLPLPRPLHFLYPLLRLPLWLWRRIKLALNAPRLRPG